MRFVLRLMGLSALVLVGGWLVGSCSDSKAHDREIGRPSDPKRVALLVGIQDYSASSRSDVPALHAPRNDVRLVEQTLVDRFGFDAGSILTLTDDRATHRGIVTAIQRWLIEGSRVDSEVVFWFCGHGSRVPDRAHAEQSGFDSTLVAWDSREEHEGAYDIADDELRALIQAIPARRVMVVTDCCHSGTVLRAGSGQTERRLSMGVEPWDPGLLEVFWPRDISVVDDAPRRARSLDYVHIAAARDDELAFEWVPDRPVVGFEAGAAFGGLTYFLIGALRSADVRSSFTDIVADARRMVADHMPQTVVAEGDLGRTVFSGARQNLPGRVRALVRADGALELTTGTMFGVHESSVVDVLDAEGRAELGRATVVEARPWSSLAHWDDNPDGACEPGNWLVVRLRERASSLRRLRVAVQTNSVELNDWIVSVPDDGAHDYLLRDGRDGPELMTRSGLRVWPNETRRSFVDASAREARWRSMRQLGGPGFEGDLGVALTLRPGADDLDPALELTARLERRPDIEGGGYRARLPRKGSPKDAVATFDVANTGTEPVYVSLVSCSESRVVGMMHDFPVLVEPAERTSFGVTLFVDAHWPAERIMCDRFLAIVTREPHSIGPLLAQTTRNVQAAARAPAVLRRALSTDLQVCRSRVPEEPGWGVASVDVQVTELIE